MTGGALLAAAYSTSTPLLATGSNSGTVTLWNVSDPRHPLQLQVFQGPATEVTTLDFDADGKNLIATDGDQEAISWSVENAALFISKPLLLACGLVHEGLTETEWREQLPGHGYRPTC